MDIQISRWVFVTCLVAVFGHVGSVAQPTFTLFSVPHNARTSGLAVNRERIFAVESLGKLHGWNLNSSSGGSPPFASTELRARIRVGTDCAVELVESGGNTPLHTYSTALTRSREGSLVLAKAGSLYFVFEPSRLGNFRSVGGVWNIPFAVDFMPSGRELLVVTQKEVKTVSVDSGETLKTWNTYLESGNHWEPKRVRVHRTGQWFVFFGQSWLPYGLRYDRKEQMEFNYLVVGRFRGRPGENKTHLIWDIQQVDFPVEDIDVHPVSDRFIVAGQKGQLLEFDVSDPDQGMMWIEGAELTAHSTEGKGAIKDMIGPPNSKDPTRRLSLAETRYPTTLVRYSPSGQLILAGHENGKTLHRFDSRSGDELPSVKLPRGMLNALAVPPHEDGQVAVGVDSGIYSVPLKELMEAAP